MIVLYFFAVLIIGSAAVAGISAAPWVPTKSRDRAFIFDHLALKGSEAVVDLGSGNGAMLFAAAQRFPAMHAVGYEISFLPLCLAWARKLLFRRVYRNVALRFGNLFTADISKADVIFVFLLNKAYPRLKAKLAKEMRPDALVVIEVWPLPDCTPFRTLRGELTLPVYIYRGSDLQ